MTESKKIVVFCGSKVGNSPLFALQAKLLGQLLAQNKFEVIYGGDPHGLMNELADGVLLEGGQIHGYLVAPWNDCRSDITSTSYNSPTERKMAMRDADGFILLPGGLGSLGEFTDILDYNVMRNHNNQSIKPLAILNTDGFYNHLHLQLENANAMGFIHDRDKNIYFIDSDVTYLVEKMTQKLAL